MLMARTAGKEKAHLEDRKRLHEHFGLLLNQPRLLVVPGRAFEVEAADIAAEVEGLLDLFRTKQS